MNIDVIIMLATICGIHDQDAEIKQIESLHILIYVSTILFKGVSVFHLGRNDH